MSKEFKDIALGIADKMSEYSLYAVIFFIPISIAAVESFICFALLGFIIKKIILPDFTFIKSHFSFVLLLFLIFCSFSLFNSGLYINKSINALFFKWGQYILIYFLVQDTLFSYRRIKNAVVILLFAGSLVALDGLFQYFFGWEFRGRQIIVTAGGIKAITGPFKHYNAFAAYLVCVLILFITTIFDRNSFKFSDFLKNKAMYCLKFFLLFLLLCCFLLTFSRGGWFSFLFASLLIGFFSRKWEHVVSVFSFFIIILVLAPAIRERLMFIFQPGGDANRFGIWNVAWNMIKENPFLGKGVGTFMAYFTNYNNVLGVQYAHNSFLQILAETGIFAFSSFVAFITLILWQGIKSFLKFHDYLVLGLLCAIFGYLVHSFFDNHLYSLQLAVLFWFMAGMLVVVSKDRILQ